MSEEKKPVRGYSTRVWGISFLGLGMVGNVMALMRGDRDYAYLIAISAGSFLIAGAILVAGAMYAIEKGEQRNGQ